MSQNKNIVNRVLNLTFNCPTFNAYNMPAGFLKPELACHALWYYYITGRNAWENAIKDPIVLEGEKDPEINLQQLFMSIATMYGVRPEHMVHYWINVDMQCDLLKLPRMPVGDQYRFNVTPEIKTQ